MKCKICLPVKYFIKISKIWSRSSNSYPSYVIPFTIRSSEYMYFVRNPLSKCSNVTILRHRNKRYRICSRTWKNRDGLYKPEIDISGLIRLYVVLLLYILFAWNHILQLYVYWRKSVLVRVTHKSILLYYYCNKYN